VTNNQSGEVTVRVHRIIEVGGGLNYIDTHAINQYLTNNGGPLYTVSVYDLSAFPNNLR
jgi:hypothetical protein